jgi:hypothetical protein
VVWVALGLLALIDIWIVLFLYQELKKSELSLIQTIRSVSRIDTETLQREIENIPKEMVIKNYLKLP